MSRTFNHSFKVHYREYLKHKDEPWEQSLHDDAETELDLGLIKSSFYEKRRLRRTAERLRKYGI